MPYRRIPSHLIISFFEYFITIVCIQSANKWFSENGFSVGYPVYTYVACFVGAFYFVKSKMKIPLSNINFSMFLVMTGMVGAGVGLGMALAGAVETYFAIMLTKYVILTYMICGAVGQLLFDGLIKIGEEFKNLPWGKWMLDIGNKFFGKMK